MSVGAKKQRKEARIGWESTVDHYAPDMYELLYCKNESEVIDLTNQLHPEIALILPSVTESDPEKGIRIVKSTTLIISKKPGNTGISRDIRTEFTTDLLLSD